MIEKTVYFFYYFHRFDLISFVLVEVIIPIIKLIYMMHTFLQHRMMLCYQRCFGKRKKNSI